MDATAVPVAITATDTRGRLNLAASLDVSTPGIELTQGRWKGKFEIIALFITADASAVGDVLAGTATLNLCPETCIRMLQTGVPYRKEIKNLAKVVELKVFVENLASGRIGTLTIPLSEVKK